MTLVVIAAYLVIGVITVILTPNWAMRELAFDQPAPEVLAIFLFWPIVALVALAWFVADALMTLRHAVRRRGQ